MRKDRLADISLKNIDITDKFWNKYRSLVKDVIIPYQWNTLNDNVPDAEPSHCIENFRIAAGRKNRRVCRSGIPGYRRSQMAGSSGLCSGIPGTGRRTGEAGR